MNLYTVNQIRSVMSFLYMAVFCYGILDGNELYHLSAGIALFLNSTLQTEWDQRSRFTLLWFLVFGSIVGLIFGTWWHWALWVVFIFNWLGVYTYLLKPILVIPQERLESYLIEMKIVKWSGSYPIALLLFILIELAGAVAYYIIEGYAWVVILLALIPFRLLIISLSNWLSAEG